MLLKPSVPPSNLRHIIIYRTFSDRVSCGTDLQSVRAVSDGHCRMSNEAPKTILIVEDEPTQRILAKEILESAGYIVRSSDDGKHGLNMAIKTQPDLIILDLMLPSLDGYAVCTALRECERTAQIPIILITGSKEPDVIKRGLAAGANDFVNKPVEIISSNLFWISSKVGMVFIAVYSSI